MILVFGSVNVSLVMPVSSLPESGETVLTEECRQMSGGKGAKERHQNFCY
jgi:sugar/nucleoside kinase (ribokinase family)